MRASGGSPSPARSASTAADTSRAGPATSSGAAGRMTPTDAVRSRRMSVLAAPKAERTAAASGTSTAGARTASAIAGVNSGPHPP